MNRVLRSWTWVLPAAAAIGLVLAWGRSLSTPAVVVVTVLLVAAVLCAVHHAEVVAHRLGEPFGSLLLAVAVTVIEVGLIVTLMISSSGDKSATLARDTVFAAVMITCNGIVGLSLLVATLRTRVAEFNAAGSGAALATVITLSTMSLVLPTFTTSVHGPQFSSSQLAFAAFASLALYLLFAFVQTVRHRDQFMPVTGDIPRVHDDGPADETSAPSPTPSDRATWTSLALLLVSLVAVVGLAKAISPTIESGVRGAGLPVSVVGVVIALLVLLPEGISAVRAALKNEVQTSLNLAYGSAMASIGLTIPVIAVATIWLSGPLTLGLGPTELVLLALTAVTGVLTVTPGKATLLQAGVHLTIFAGFLFLAASP